VPDDCARTVISLEANALLSHEVVNTPPPPGCFRISTVLWLYPTEPIVRDYTPLRTANMSPEEVAAYAADAPARRSAQASSNAKKGRAKMGPERCRAAAKSNWQPRARESNYSLGDRTPAQKENMRKACALPSVFMSHTKWYYHPTLIIPN
jgi:hypothetical protein